MQAETQEHDLLRAGADVYTPREYSEYLAAHRLAKDNLINQNARLFFLRDYDKVTLEYGDVLSRGAGIAELIKKAREDRRRNAEGQLDYIKKRIASIRKASVLINEGRHSRADITTAEVLISEAEGLMGKGQYAKAEERIKRAVGMADSATKSLIPTMARYGEREQVDRWRSWVQDTIQDSKRSGGHAIVVNKSTRSLTLYRGGKIVKTYTVGLGINGTGDKHYAGDRATPEGRYRIIRKVPHSKFYRALLINYPNDEDRRKFSISKSKGIIPKNVEIGGLIEIHGGGKDGMTYGCVALDNRHIEELFNAVGLDTPVTIVGALDYDNDLAEAIREL